MPQPYIKGRLAEDGQTMEFPAIDKDGSLLSMFKASYHVGRNQPTFYGLFELSYFVVPEGTRLDIVNACGVSVPFKEKGEVKDVRRFKIDPITVTTAGTTLVKVHPKTAARIQVPDGQPMYAFQMGIGFTPKIYENLDEMAFDFALLPDSEKAKLAKPNQMSEWAMIERGSRVIKLPGAVLFPDYCAFRLPGWIAKEFNGSPEFGFAIGDAKEPRKGEQLHHHAFDADNLVMEPYIGRQGVIRIFAGVEGGSETYRYKDMQGNGKECKGEILEVREGDVFIPMPDVPHRIIYEGSQFPFAQYTINYAARAGKLLSDISTPRVALEKA